jgi:hypothetical protein
LKLLLDLPAAILEVAIVEGVLQSTNQGVEKGILQARETVLNKYKQVENEIKGHAWVFI